MLTKNERGTVLVLIALLSTAIIVLVAIALDTSIASTSKAQRHHAAEFGALGAMEAYVNSSALSNPGRLQDAINRAKEIIGKNIMLGTPFLQKDLLTIPQNEIDKGAGGENGTLVPGIWHLAEPLSPNQCDGSYLPITDSVPSQDCPCSLAGQGSWNGQCFEEIKQDAGTSTNASAMRITLKLHKNSLLKSLFGSVSGQKTMSFTTTSTASLVPRRAFALVDLSRSMHRDTHRFIFDFPSPQGSEYAHLFNNATDCLTANPDTQLHPIDQSRYNGLAIGPRPAGAIVPTLHYKLQQDGVTPEFSCKAVDEGNVQYSSNNVIHYGENIGTSYFLLDQTVAPEPLTGILDSIHSGMKIFSDRSVGNDKFGFIGFENEILSSRYLALTTPVADIDTAASSDPVPSPNEFVNFYRATDVSDINNKVPKLLFPRLLDSKDKLARTNVHLPLNRAFELLKIPFSAFIKAENFIILFTDGLDNCMYDISISKWVCKNQYSHFLEAGRSTRSWVKKHVKSHNVSIHVFLIGDQVGPHTLLRKFDNSRCMTDEEARADSDDTQFVDTSETTWGDTPFYEPNQLYDDVAAKTDGIWAPIRPCCLKMGANGTTSCHDFTAALNADCGKAASHGDHVNAIPTALANNFHNPGNSYFDNTSGKGRLLCDPQGRTKSQQAKDYMRKIFSRNPIALVE